VQTGFEETTFSQIAKCLGLSQPAIYGHFKNKMELMSAACDLAAQKGRDFIDARIDMKGSAASRFGDYLEGNFLFFSTQKEYAFAISSIYFFCHTHPQLTRVFEQMVKSGESRVEQFILQYGYEKGVKIKNTATLAQVIHSTLIGEVYKCMNSQSQMTPRERSKFLLREIVKLLAASTK
jgi:AcrR family transcriptional regulator